mgnify:CR=1 FL=1
MNISEQIKNIIDKEFDVAVKKMEESQTPEEMLFFFSAIHAVINRAFNIEFSKELLFANFILDNSYKSMIERMHQIKAGQQFVRFHNDFGEKLLNLTKELQKNFYKKNKRNETLNEIVLLAHTTTGNGYYLLQKDALPIFQEKKKNIDLE